MKKITTKIKSIAPAKFFVAVFMIGLVSAACGGGNGGGNQPIQLKVWGTFETTEVLQPMFAAFSQRYPQVTISYTQKNVETYESDLLNALATGNGPDIYAIHNDWLPEYKDRLAAAPEAMMTIREFKDTFVDVVSSDFITDNKIYAMPLSVDSLALYYNKDILGSFGIATPAKTWEELQAHVRTITDQSNRNFIRRSGVALGTTNNINRPMDILYLFMLQNRTPLYTSDFSQPTFDQSTTDGTGSTFFPGANALSFYTSFSNANSNVYSWNTNSNYSFDAFANGDVAYMFAYSYAKDTIRRKAPNLNYDVAPVPQPRTGQTLVNFSNYWGFGVSQQTKNSDAAWALIGSMTTKESLESYYQRHLLPSSRKDIVESQTRVPGLGVFAHSNLTAKSFYKKDADMVDQIFVDMINDVVLRGRSVNQALNNAAQRVGLIFTQRR